MKVILALQHTLQHGSSIRNHLETKIVQLWSWSKYFHSEIIIDNNWISSGPSHGGVYIHKLQPLRKEYDYIEIEVDAKKLESVMKFIESQLGSEYDWTGVFLLGLNSNAHNESKWFCSEICAEILLRFGVKLKLASNQYTPNGLRKELKWLDDFYYLTETKMRW